MDEFEGIVETAIYVDDLSRAETFYRDVLGLEPIGHEAGRHLFFRVGARQVLLIFIAQSTRRGEHLPPHGCDGAGHFALGVRPGGLDAWRRRLAEHGVAIEKEVEWPRGGHSLYFRDPAGNSVEIVTPGIWGLPGGW
jgi:catechol 2,3-dioxygenase-like lactoylglutathione lyase family enzyme